MKKLLILFIIISCATFFFACGSKKKVKQPSTEYLYTTESFNVVDSIRIAYQNKDYVGIRKYCSESAYRAIITSIRPFDKAEIEFTPVLVEIEDDVIKLYVSWNGKWKYLGTETEERGMASFLLKGKPLKVEKIIRGNPFKYPD